MPSKFKNLVRTRMAEIGEGWQAASRHVRNQEEAQRDSAVVVTAAPVKRMLPSIHHVYLEDPTPHAIDVFAANQTVAWFIGKFAKGAGAWSSTTHRLDPVYQRATWAREEEPGWMGRRVKSSSVDELRALAVRALDGVHPDGRLLVVHAPGQIAFMWSDHPVPRVIGDRQVELFGPPMQSVPRQSIVEGPPPSWWPETPLAPASTAGLDTEGDDARA